MKTTRTRKNRRSTRDDLRREYRFDHRTAKPNRLASAMKGDSVAILLDPDVAAVFDTSESVNKMLRSVIAAMPRSDDR